MECLPWELLGHLLPFLDSATLRAMSQTCTTVEAMARQLVRSVKLSDPGSLRAALQSCRFGPGFAACCLLEVQLREVQDVRMLISVLGLVHRHWIQLHSLRLSLHGEAALGNEGDGDDTGLAHTCRDVLPCLAIVPLMPSLRRLEINFSMYVDPAVLYTLGSITQLTALHVRLAGGGHILTPLGQLTQLQELDLRAWVRADSNGWLPSSLQHLTLGAGDEQYSGIAWALALAACSQLRSLTLQGLYASYGFDAGNVQLDMAHATQLTRLDGYVMGDCLALTGLPPSLRVLMLTISHPPGDEGLSWGTPACYLPNGPSTLMGCVDLEVLQLACQGGALPYLPKLRKACVGICGDEEGGLESVGESALRSLPTTLTSLEVAPYVCSIAPMEHLTHCVNLRELCLKDSDGDSFTLDCQHLQPLTALNKLVLCADSRGAYASPSAFTILHAERLHLVPLQQLHVSQQQAELISSLQGLVGESCEVVPV